MKVSIFGIGYVGTVSAACLADLGHDVTCVDVNPAKIEMLNSGRAPIVEAGIEQLIAAGVESARLRASADAAKAVIDTDVSFICVGTPSAADGSLSMAAIDRTLAAIGRAIGRKATPHTVVMRSTVTPATADRHAIPLLEETSGRRRGDGLLYYVNPEFLREGSAVNDFRAPPFTVIGAPVGDDATALREIYAAINAPLHLCSYRVAESVKYLSNVYHAVKLAFANEAGAILAARGVDAREAFRIFCEDRTLNISSAYLRPGFAFGGSCLPKDLRGFLALADEVQVSAPLLRQVLPSNSLIVERAYEAIASLGRQRVSLFGLAFKQGTDDLRESPFVLLAERLIGRGFDLRIFDRSVEMARLMGSNRDYIENEIPHLARLMTASPEETLEGSRVAVIGHIGQEDRLSLLSALQDVTVLDFVGIPALSSCPRIRYQGLCW